MEENKEYGWKYCSVGGVVRVNISSGEDIAHLGELDQKMWTALSCPVEGLEMDPKTLGMIDTDGDGKIRVPEVVSAARWLTEVIKDRDLILKGDSTLPLDQFNTDSATGARLQASARQILDNLGLRKDEISVNDVSDSCAIFARTAYNGDGVITPTSTEDAALAKTIEQGICSVGSVPDRSGVPGIDAEKIEAFYTALADYSAWKAESEASPEAIFPFGGDTAGALADLEAVKDKIDDYFMRCKLIAFDKDTAPAVDVSLERIGEISARNLAACADEISLQPLARPCEEAVLPMKGINPAWKERFDAFRFKVLGEECEALSEEEWVKVQSRFDAYKAWLASRKGAEVEALGIERVRELLAEDSKQALLDIVAADKALEYEANSIDEVCKLLYLYRDFYTLLKNYVIFSDFYNRGQGSRAIFEAGELYIDQRCCNLCVKVSDMGVHADMAALSGMFLVYCHCSSKIRPESFDIAAVLTDGSTLSLRPGKNAVFYDRDGLDWDAVVTKVVDNPLSVKSAFWSPYRKLADFISSKIDKSASDKDASAIASLQKSAEGGVAQARQPFDIAKFSGIFAALGLAVAALGAALTAILKGLLALPWWKVIIVLVVILLIISGPACFIAWKKLRKRNLGPVLNANGWAINSVVLVNVPFGGLLTTTAEYPLVKMPDPFVKRTPVWKKILRWFLLLVVAAFAVMYFTDNLKFMGIHKKQKARTEQVAEPSPEAQAVEASTEPASESGIAAEE